MILVDLNVVLDVVQRRDPFYQASALVLDGVFKQRVKAKLPAHGVTTIHYVAARYQSRPRAQEVVARLLRHFEIAAIGLTGLASSADQNLPSHSASSW